MSLVSHSTLHDWLPSVRRSRKPAVSPWGRPDGSALELPSVPASRDSLAIGTLSGTQWKEQMKREEEEIERVLPFYRRVMDRRLLGWAMCECSYAANTCTPHTRTHAHMHTGAHRSAHAHAHTYAHACTPIICSGDCTAGRAAVVHARQRHAAAITVALRRTSTPSNGAFRIVWVEAVWL